MKKALLIRLDKIGDLVLTLPADRQPALKGYDCHWYISQGLGFVADHAVPVRKYDEGQKAFSLAQALRFFMLVHTLKPEITISFHAPWWVNFILWLARVPKRVGVLSQWHSYLFLNRGVRQKRSLCEHHELEYNHLLVQQGLQDTTIPLFPHLTLSARFEGLPVELPAHYGVVHPGMAGSALNWPIEHYVSLITKLSADVPVIITGTAGDRFILEPLKEKLSGVKNVIWLNEQLKPAQLLRVLKSALFVFAPSTGVIHLAAALGTPTYGIYSPIKVESANRWGPRGDSVKIHTPKALLDPRTDKSQAAQSMALVTPQEIYDDISIRIK